MSSGGRASPGSHINGKDSDVSVCVEYSTAELGPLPGCTMASSSRRAVITGLGVISPIGLTKDAFWEALSNRRSGIRPISAFDASALPTRIAGEVVGFDPKNYVD